VIMDAIYKAVKSGSKEAIKYWTDYISAGALPH
jgi:hypothetical protein